MSERSTNGSSSEAIAGRIPIRILIPLAMAICILVAGLGFFLSYREALEASLEREAARDLNLDMTRLGAALEGATGANNSAWRQEHVAALGAETHALLAILVDASDRVVASANRNNLDRPLRDVLPPSLTNFPLYQSAALARARTDGGSNVQTDRDLQMVVGLQSVVLQAAQGEARPAATGLLLVARDLASRKAQLLSETHRRARQIVLGLLALAVATSVLLHLRITRRLAGIAGAADRFARGDFSARSGVTGGDEIALLGRSFDSMVTAMQEHEAALVESEERHRSLFQNAVEGVITMGEDRLIQSINPAAQKLFGYTEGELIGKNVKVLMPSPYHEEHDGYVQGYLRTGKKKIIGIGREVMGQRKDGTTFPLDLSVVELQLTHERLFTGIVRDITDRKQAESALQRLNEQLEELVGERTRALESAQEALVRKERLATLGQLASSVAHEIRNPLGIVRNATYYVEQTSRDPDAETRESFEEIRRGLSRADRIITDLLDYARDPRSHRREFALDGAIQDAFEGVDISPDITVDRSPPNPALSCYGDPDQITRILNNLIINATQAMSEGGGLLTVRALLDEGADSVIVEVRDTGSGMTQEHVGRIFEPLFTTKARGIGLGLSLSLRYADLNRASLSAESQPGKGSIFRLVLPRQTPEPEA